jgi:hypothetical protein
VLPLAAVFVLLELLLHRVPGDLVGHFLARLIATSLLRAFVLIPGVVVDLAKDGLRSRREGIAYAVRQIAVRLVRREVLAPSLERHWGGRSFGHTSQYYTSFYHASSKEASGVERISQAFIWVTLSPA